MANVRAIRTQIKSIKSTEKITKAMKMVAASKLRIVQNNVQNMKDVQASCHNILNTLLNDGVSYNDDMVNSRDVIKKVCYVLFLGNRGLCGVYNNTALKQMTTIAEQEKRDFEVIIVGKWGKEIIKRSGLPVREQISTIGDTPQEEDAVKLADHLKELYLSGEFDEVNLVYMSFVSALRQVPKTRQLFPLNTETEDHSDDNKKYDSKEVMFLPDKNTIMEHIIRLYTDNLVYNIILEAKMGEHSSRMTAMTAATDSTKELLAKLGLMYNRARQSLITNEIIEIVSGAAALTNK